MDKNYQSSGDSTINGRDHHLKQLNHLSHKISKPNLTKKPAFDPNRPQPQPQQLQQQQQPQQPQPRVYNINKNDFRDVVQKLTGSPARDGFSDNPPPIQPPKLPSSRLQRIRPPPLPQVNNRPPPLINNAVPPPQVAAPPVNMMQPRAQVNGFIPQQPPPISPAFHLAAESPVSAYMRYLQNSMFADSNSPLVGLSPLVSPRWSYQVQPPQQPYVPQQQQGLPPSPQMPAMLPNSPSPFGFLNSPRSSYPLLSPSLLLSPYSFPLSPTVPLPSPVWRGM